MNTSIRRAEIDDLETIQNIFINTIKHTCQQDYHHDQIDAWLSSVENKSEWISKIAKQYFILAQSDHHITGFGSLENGNYIDMMYVDKSYQRFGVASCIYQNLKKEALKQGHHQLTTHASKTALPFFKAKNFKIIKENKVEINQVELVNYYMSQ